MCHGAMFGNEVLDLQYWASAKALLRMMRVACQGRGN